MNIYLVDDEEPARNILHFFLEDITGTKVVGENGDPLHAITEINRLKPDLVLLDIQMPVLNGFEVLPYLEHKPLIIFCTAYDEFAIRAFEVNALDYLQKPIDEERLRLSLERAQNEWERIMKLERRVIYPSGIEKVVVGIGSTHKVIWVEDVRMFVKEGRYTNLVTEDGHSYLSNFTLGYLDEHLTHPDFCRINRSHIIHRKYVQGYQAGTSGTLVLTLPDGEHILVSRRRVKAFKQWFLKRTPELPDLTTESPSIT